MNSLQFGEFTLNRRLRELRRGDAVVSIPGKAFDLLSYMVANPGRPLTKTELLDAVWPNIAVEESNLSQNVFLLRKVLGSPGDGPIKTLPGRGYQFAAEVSELDAQPAPHAGPVDDRPLSTLMVEATETRLVVEHKIEETSRTPTRALVLTMLLVLAMAIAAGWIWRQHWLDRTGGPPVQVVLVPLEGTTGDPVLDKSLTQAMRMDLAQSPFVTVVPGSTVMATLKDMGHKPDAVMTPEMAREVCERTNSQGLLSGNIAKTGQHFLITGEASNCVDGTMLGEGKYEAARAEDLPHAIDKLAADLRQKLGESRRSIARFNMPLFAQTTPSLDALKAYTQGVQCLREGKYPEGISLMKTAIAADPKFAAAYYNLAAAYSSVGDDSHTREAIAKAYALRNTASKATQYGIETMYASEYTGDMYELLRSFQSWVAMYPNSSQAWSGLANAQGDLGMDTEALASQQRTLALLPHSQGMLANLVMLQMKVGDANAARATCERAIRDNLDGDGIRVRYLQVAYLLQEPALLQEQRKWEATHPQALMILNVEAEIAMAEGRFSDAHKLIAQLRDAYRQQGLSGPDEERTKFAAVDLMQLGDLEAGKKIFQQAPVDVESGQEVLGLVYAGDIPEAQAGIRANAAKYPQATAWKFHWQPRIEAAIAMAQHRPADAAALLDKTEPFIRYQPFLQWHRGEAFFAAGQPAQAEKDLRGLIGRPGEDPASPYISLSWLGLGEALTAQGKKQEAVDAYQHFFKLWAHADPDAKYLLQAKQEFAQLQSATPAH